MIRITDKTLCTGCTACVTICPAQCIVMRRDRQGFDYPVANPDLCIGCGKCESVCPVSSPKPSEKPLASYAVRVPEYVSESSSGGVFPFLAARTVSEGGYVFGAALNSDLSVGHADASSKDGIERLRGSKYVQSDLYSVLQEVKDLLEDGSKVLFSGTPCQVAGLKAYLGKDYDGLLAVDLACHGVPSPGLWEKYVRALEGKTGSRIVGVRFRDKSDGWMHYDFTVETEDGNISVPYMEDPYMALFVQDMTLRPSCYSCAFRRGRSGSDMTLSDFWSVRESVTCLDDDKGASLVLVYSDKGVEALGGMEVLDVDPDREISLNGGFSGQVPVPQKRDEFFKGVHSASDLIAYMESYVVRPPLVKRVFKKVRRWLSRLKRRITR